MPLSTPEAVKDYIQNTLRRTRHVQHRLEFADALVALLREQVGNDHALLAGAYLSVFHSYLDGRLSCAPFTQTVWEIILEFSYSLPDLYESNYRAMLARRMQEESIPTTMLRLAIIRLCLLRRDLRDLKEFPYGANQRTLDVLEAIAEAKPRFPQLAETFNLFHEHAAMHDY